MTICAEVVQAELSLVERRDVRWPLPPETQSCDEPDWRSLFERERACAEAAEARCEELRWAEVDSRARAGSLKWRLDVCRRKLQAAVEETKEVRRTAKDALSLKAEVGRLEKLLSEAGVEPCKRSTNVSLRMEVYRLGVALGAAGIAKERLKTRLLRASEAARSRSPSREDAELRKALRRSRRRKTAIKSLSRENARLRKAVRKSETRQTALEVQLAKLRATGAVLSKALFGRRIEQQERPRSERRRGRQPGAVGHGRTPRPALEEREDVRNPPADARVCAGCGKPYVANGAEVSTIVDIGRAAGTRFWFHGLRNVFITVAERELMLPRSLTKRLVNHARDDDITEGYAADWTVEQLREPSQRIADRIDALMNVDATAETAVI